MITIVTGLPRSGTSMMMQMLVAGGLPALVDDNAITDVLNPKGYVEMDAVKHLPRKPEIILQAEGKCVKIISEWMIALPGTIYDTVQPPRSMDKEYRVIFMRRPIHEIMESQRQWLEARFRWYVHVWADAADRSKIELQYNVHIHHLEFMLNCRRIPTLVCNYHEALTTPINFAEKVKKFLDLDLNILGMIGVVDRKLWRYR